MKIGVFFGSFNPIHIGHMMIAEYIYEYSDLDQIWFIVSPQNPFKKKDILLEDHHRLEMVYRAIGDDNRFRVSNIEFRMPKPSFTIDTLTWISEMYPNDQFAMIMGSDNLKNFHKWKNHRLLIENYPRYVYPRYGDSELMSGKHENIIMVKAPKIEISGSMIRESISGRKTLRYFLPEKVYQYIDEMNFYKKKLI